ncbi:hypothetical protein [Planococcus halotolerans]|uniref:hypothetical protein n=1 Tax=Planococcus halotolerans TaxID=2233542 RepID=UPI001401BFD9|nr:hypothetical protein [Planococcus halotolerans]
MRADMNPRSQGQMVADQLAARVGQLELEKAIIQANLESKTHECEAYKEEIGKLKGEK